MRRIRSATIVFLILLLLMSGCDSAGTAETTLSPETTLPAETTLPPETTVPPETTAPPATETEPTVSVLDGIPFHEAYEADGFVHFYGEPLYTENGGGLYYQLYYQYAGDSPVIELRSMGITLTLPEEWLDQVMVIRYWNHPYNEGLYIVNKNLWNAYQEESPAAGPNNGLQDFILSIYCLPTSRYSGPEQFSGSSMEYLHEVDQLVYFLIMGMPEDSHFTSVRNDLIQKIGQDAYDELVGDLVLDFETAKGMITFMY